MSRKISRLVENRKRDNIETGLSSFATSLTTGAGSTSIFECDWIGFDGVRRLEETLPSTVDGPGMAFSFSVTAMGQSTGIRKVKTTGTRDRW
jgi:hypothetical protein